MRLRNVKVGKTYVIRYSLPEAQRFPAVRGTSRAKVVEVIPGEHGRYGRAKVEWPAWRWDYENRPEGWSEVRWMIDEKSNKKKVWAPKYEMVLARRILEEAS